MKSEEGNVKRETTRGNVNVLQYQVKPNINLNSMQGFHKSVSSFYLKILISNLVQWAVGLVDRVTDLGTSCTFLFKKSVSHCINHALIAKDIK